MNASKRSIIYVATIVVAVVSIILAVLIVMGILTQEAVLAVAILAPSLFGAIAGALAKMNLTPDDVVSDDFSAGGTDD